MKIQAVTITLTAMIDIDDMTPDLALDVNIEPAFSFLASQKPILAGWMRSCARQLDPESDAAPSGPQEGEQG